MRHIGWLIAVCLCFWPTPTQAQTTTPTWQPINGNGLDDFACFDTLHSDVFWNKDGNAYNWRTGQQLTTYQWPVGHTSGIYAMQCAPGGNVYLTVAYYAGDTPAEYYHLTLTQAPQRIAHQVDFVVSDGSNAVYSQNIEITDTGFRSRRSSLQLYLSRDNGQNWQAARPIRDAHITAVFVSPIDANLVRVLAWDKSATPFRMRMYTSTNAGQSWQTSAWRSLDSMCDYYLPRATNPFTSASERWDRCHIFLQFGMQQEWENRASSFNGVFGNIHTWQIPRSYIDATIMSMRADGEANGYDFTHYISTDNGGQWRKQYEPGLAVYPYASDIDLSMLGFYGATTANHQVRLRHADFAGDSTVFGPFGFAVDISTNNGQSWHTVATLSRPGDWPASDAYRDGSPYDYATLTSPPSVVVNPMLPNNIVAHDSGGIHYSADGGLTWQRLADGASTRKLIAVTTHHPLTIIRETRSGTYEALTLPNSAASAVRRGVNHGYINGYYANETGHDIAPAFLDYWRNHGGLAQFGFPTTEPFYEVNDDGQVYLVQYFERNRFEHHPELAGTEYEVLLGLIGTHYAEAARTRAPGSFMRQSGASEPGQLYFAETGHTLRNAFKRHWQSTGGLAQYGYPISEEFYEVNPDNGQTYVVQYFERARFEWHPELAGTPYEVLLGLLGNQLLHDKGW